MRKFILGAALAACLSSSLALADEIKATITHIDVNARIIVVDGRAFHVGADVDITVFKIGDVVTIDFAVVDGQLKIVSIKVD
jgi:Cu/Ag efflux protein CusF